MRPWIRSLIGVLLTSLVIGACSDNGGTAVTDAPATQPDVSSTEPSDGSTIDLDQEPNQTGHPYRLEVSPDGSDLAVFNDSDFVRVYDLTSGEQQRSLQIGGDIHWSGGEALASDWSLMATPENEGAGVVRDFESFQPVVSQVSGCGFPEAFSPNNQLLVMGGIDDAEGDCRGELIDWASGEVVIDFGERHVHHSLFNHGGPESGRYLTLVTNVSVDSEDTATEIYDVTTGDLVRETEIDQGLKLAQDATGQYLAVGNFDGSVQVLDFPALVGGASVEDATIRAWDAHSELVIDITFAPNGLLATSSPGSVKVWDVDSGDMVSEATVEEDFWTFIAFSPKSDYLLYVEDVSTLRRLEIDPA